jgi:hypothetical protein
MQQPPLLPEEILHRVLRLARMEGISVLMIAGFLALASAAASDYVGAIIGLLVAGAGAIELHGEGLLRGGYPRGVNWLVASQLYLMTVVIGYCGMQLAHPVLAPVPAALKPLIETSAEQLQMTTQEYLLMLHRLTFRLLALLTFLYQGAMAIYYYRRREAIERALGKE